MHVLQAFVATDGRDLLLFAAILNIAPIFKPLMGIVTDNVRLCGSHRKVTRTHTRVRTHPRGFLSPHRKFAQMQRFNPSSLIVRCGRF
jgi:hypothetical protein